MASRQARIGFRSLFRHEQWNIGIVDQPVEEFVRSASRPAVRWLPATARSEFRADPFGLMHEGRAIVLCEHYSYRDNVGFIVALDPDDAARYSRVQIGPEPPVHLSYPSLIESQGQIFCMPESSAAQEIAFYEIQQFPLRWAKSATLIAGRGYVDATAFQHEGRWWLAASNLAKQGANSELHLWHAAELRGPWRAHAGNPVKIDVRSARPAGPVFWADGDLYRPAQDCASGYGTRVVINRVSLLNPWEFREEVATAVEPDRAGAYPAGLHTLSSLGDKTLIDGKRMLFVLPEFLRIARHYLRALIK
jgi:hypothetical protein